MLVENYITHLICIAGLGTLAAYLTVSQYYYTKQYEQWRKQKNNYQR